MTSDRAHPGGSSSDRRDLAPTGPLSKLDRAFAMVRAAGPRTALAAWGAGALVASVLFLAHYLEEVEGLRSLRGPLALALCAAWWGRAQILSSIAREHVQRLWDRAPISERAGRGINVLRTAAWFGIFLWPWAWVFWLGALGGVIGALLVLPLFSMRGAFAPAWLARAGCTGDAGLRAVRNAFVDSNGQRVSGVVIELVVLLGGATVFLGLLATIATFLLLGRSFLGLELALLDQLLSPRNTFVIVGCALASAVLFEPVRAAISAATWVEARVREEGLDLRALVEDAIAHGSPSAPRSAASAEPGARSSGRAAARGTIAALVLLGLTTGLLPGAARAQDEGDAGVRPFEAPAFAAPDPSQGEIVLDPGDERAITRAEAILERDEFVERGDQAGRSLREMLERIIAWLLEHRDPIDLPDQPEAPALQLPGPVVFIVLAVLVLVALALIAMMTRPDRWATQRPVAADGPGSAHADDPRGREPVQWVDDAAALAARGQFREALRALYLATLVALDRRRLIRFDRALTNGQYLRQMPDVPARRDFREFTRLFDHKWYGREPTTELDYQSGRELAERIVSGEARS